MNAAVFVYYLLPLLLVMGGLIAVGVHALLPKGDPSLRSVEHKEIVAKANDSQTTLTAILNHLRSETAERKAAEQEAAKRARAEQLLENRTQAALLRISEAQAKAERDLAARSAIQGPVSSPQSSVDPVKPETTARRG